MREIAKAKAESEYREAREWDKFDKRMDRKYEKVIINQGGSIK